MCAKPWQHKWNDIFHQEDDEKRKRVNEIKTTIFKRKNHASQIIHKIGGKFECGIYGLINKFKPLSVHYAHTKNNNNNQIDCIFEWIGSISVRVQILLRPIPDLITTA